MSYGSFVHAEAQARQEAQRATERKASEQRHKIRAWVAQAVPECVRPAGGPDPLVVGRAMTRLYAAERKGEPVSSGEFRAHIFESFPQYAPGEPS